MKKNRRRIIYLLMVCVLDGLLLGWIRQCGRLMNLSRESIHQAAFRELELGEEGIEALDSLQVMEEMADADVLAVALAFTGFSTDGIWSSLDEEFVTEWKGRYLEYRGAAYEMLQAVCAALLEDPEYFPVAQEQISFENSWMFERTYGGRRGHEGTDLMPPKNIAGQYPVVSMTDGVVEQIGWLEKGGYRVGIRSPNGGCFYYAHLDSYREGLQKGQWVNAGTFLGFMGDTGYGEEGTRSRFSVHLHFGIYFNDENGEEVSVNPYWILRRMEKHKLKYDDVL